MLAVNKGALAGSGWKSLLSAAVRAARVTLAYQLCECPSRFIAIPSLTGFSVV